LPGLADGLLQRGFEETEIRGILGGNFRRVASAVWAARPS
jgi:microsomal dipeptidase-like Zn-dependent dipeptidase